MLCDLFSAVVDGCIYDEFQREIYARPDMTLDEINALFADISAQYGVYEPTGVDYFWIYIPHNFSDPLYYISYAASALAVIQIWDAAREDLAAGMGLLKDIIAADKYNGGYVETLEQDVSLVAILVLRALDADVLNTAANVMMWLCAALTVVSGAVYLAQNIDVLKDAD